MSNSFLRLIRLFGLVPVIMLCWQACSKKVFLDAKPSTTLLVPTTLSDFQALLDNTTVFGLVPTLGESSADNYFLPFNTWYGLDTREHNAYIWAPDIFQGQGGQLDWNTPYQQVFYANVVLDGLGSQPGKDSVGEWNALEGSALFLRAFAFYNLAQVFAPVYDNANMSIDSGIPLRLHADINQVSHRSTIAQTYQQILNDLDSAEKFLPATAPNHYLDRPIRVSALALRARVYLSMRNYGKSRAYADSALQFYNSLLDYNNLDTSVQNAFNQFTNSEVLYQASFLVSSPGSSSTYSNVLVGGAFFSNTRIDSGLIQSYDPNDLRRVLYYHYKPLGDSSYLKGTYTGSGYCFGGLATDELYLIRAESAARDSDAPAAMQDINTLLGKRWRTGTFPGYTVASAREALDTVLLERRKELAFRGLRWTDLRRLNAEGANITLSRVLSQTYTLPPNSDMWVLPIPPDVLTLGSIGPNIRN